MTEPKLPSPPEGHRWAIASDSRYVDSKGPAFSLTIWGYDSTPTRSPVTLIVKMPINAINPDSVATLRNAVGPACDLVVPLADAIEDRLPRDAS